MNTTPIYYPAVAVRLTIRFDESLLQGDESPAAQTPKQMARESAQNEPKNIKQKAAMFTPADSLSHALVIVPKTANFELPSYRQAPKFSMTFDFRDVPIDPRAIRALGVEIFVGTIAGTSFAEGMRGVKTGGGVLASQIVAKEENIMLVGVVDNLTTEHGDTGSTVTMDGRGLQGMFLDAKIHAEILKELVLDKPINEVVTQLLSKAAMTQGINVRVRDYDWPNNLLPRPSELSLIPRENRGADGKKATSTPKGDPSSLSYWDVITNLCNVVGAIPYFIAHDLWIRPVRSIFAQKYATGGPGNIPTPFVNGRPRHIEIGNGKSIEAGFRKMVYGRNLLTLKLERKFGGAKVPVVQCVSLDTDKKAGERLIIAEWPPKEQRKARKSAESPSGSESQSEMLRIPVPSIKDKARLLSIAKEIYNEVGRGELGGSASTKDLASLGGDNADADLINLRPGDAIEFAVDQSGVESFPPVVSEMNRLAASDPGALSRHIQERLGFKQKLANVLAGTARGTFRKLQDVFRVANVKYDWAIESGIGVSFDFQNYITARYDFEGGDQTVTEGTSGKTFDYSNVQPRNTVPRQ